MKKKLFVGIAAGVLAAAMCVSFAACGSSVDAKSVKGEEVTEAEWDAAVEAVLNGDALTIEYLAKSSAKNELTATLQGESESLTAKSKSERRMTYIVNGAKQSGKGYVKISYGGDLEEMAAIMGQEMGAEEGKTNVEVYSEVTADGTNYYVQNKEGEWMVDHDGDTVVEEMFDELDMLKYYVKDCYGDYEYSAEHKGYIPADYEEGEPLYVIKFQDKKLVAVYMENNYKREQDLYESIMPGMMIMKMDVEASTQIVIKYETKDITLPTVG